MEKFKQLADKYEAWFRTPHGKYVFETERQLILSLLDIQPGMTVVDVGSGTGMYAREYALKGAQVKAYDISPEMLAIAQEKNRDLSEQIRFEVADAAALPVQPDSADMVSSITAIEFFGNPRACVQEMFRVLKPGGFMILASISPKHPWAWQRRIKAWMKGGIFSATHFYSTSQMAGFCQPYPVVEKRTCVYVPPFAPDSWIANPEPIERWGTEHLPDWGAFSVILAQKTDAAVPR